MGELKLSTGELGVLLFADVIIFLADSAERIEGNLKAMSEVLSRELKEDESDEGGEMERTL